MADTDMGLTFQLRVGKPMTSLSVEAATENIRHGTAQLEAFIALPGGSLQSKLGGADPRTVTNCGNQEIADVLRIPSKTGLAADAGRGGTAVPSPSLRVRDNALYP
jgi:hypothetical protein